MITDKKKTPKEIFIQEDWEMNVYGVNQDENIKGMVKYIRYDLVPKVDEKYKMPNILIHEDTSVTSRMQYIDDELKPIAEFILSYAGWNLHKEEWNHPVLEVPVFRVLDALITKGKPYTAIEVKEADWLQEIEDKLANATPQQLAEWKEKYFKEEPAEWSEEDEKILSDIIKDLVHPWNEYIPDRIEDEIKWLKNRLKSLRPQNTWKPSEEQMDALLYVCKNINPPLSDKLGWNSLRTLELMYQNLKKLRVE